MNEENTQALPLLAGQWKIKNVYRKQNRDWLRIETESYDSDVWEFSECRQIWYPSEMDAFEGKMIRYKNNRKKVEITFMFYPKTSLLYIYDPEYRDRNALYANKHYKVVRFDTSRLWLFDLHRLRDKPDDDFPWWIDITKQ